MLRKYNTMLAIWGLCLLAYLQPHATMAATLAEFEFADPLQTQEFRNLIEQLRCLVCQNESLAASQAELAQDLRREIYTMMQAGQSREQITTFLVARYGDFILYNPPLKPATYILWYGPFILFGLAGFALTRVLMRQLKAPDTDLTADEQARLATTLGGTADALDLASPMVTKDLINPIDLTNSQV